MNVPKNLISRYYHRLDGHMQEVIRGAGVTFAIRVTAAVFSFGFNVLLARLLGAEGAGIYFLALTVITIAATFGRCGLENSLLRFVSAYSVKDDWSAVKGVFQKGMLLSLSVSFVVSFLLYVSAHWLSVKMFSKPDLETPLRIMSLAVVPLAMYWIVAESLKGLRRIRDSQIVQGLSSPLLMCIGLAMVGASWGVEGVVSVYLTAAILILTLALVLWFRATSNFLQGAGDFAWGKLFGSCIPLLLIQVMYLIISWASIFALGVWGTKADVGIFGAAHRTAMLISFILISVNSIVAPKFSALYASGDMNALSAMARKSATMMTAFAVPLLLFFILAPHWAMSIFGADFIGGGILLAILSIGQFVNVATGSVGYLLIMTGHERLMCNNTVVVAMLTVLFNACLVPNFGALGAAIASCLSTATLNLGAFYFVWKALGIWTFPIGPKGKNVSV